MKGLFTEVRTMTIPQVRVDSVCEREKGLKISNMKALFEVSMRLIRLAARR